MRSMMMGVILALSTMILPVTSVAQDQSPLELIEEGEKLFGEGALTQATEKFKAAYEKAPHPGELRARAAGNTAVVYGKIDKPCLKIYWLDKTFAAAPIGETGDAFRADAEEALKDEDVRGISCREVMLNLSETGSVLLNGTEVKPKTGGTFELGFLQVGTELKLVAKAAGDPDRVIKISKTVTTGKDAQKIRIEFPKPIKEAIPYTVTFESLTSAEIVVQNQTEEVVEKGTADEVGLWEVELPNGVYSFQITSGAQVLKGNFSVVDGPAGVKATDGFQTSTEISKVPVTPKEDYVLSWVGGGVAVSGATLFGVMAYLITQDNTELATLDDCRVQRDLSCYDPARGNTLLDRSGTYLTLEMTGLALLVAGSGLLVYDLWLSGEESQPQQGPELLRNPNETKTQLKLQVSPGGAWVTGSF